MDNLELNILIAEKVFGHKIIHKTWNKGKCHSYSLGEPDYYDTQGEMILSNPLPNYCEDIKEAWEVVDKLRNPQRVFSLVTCVDYGFHAPKLTWVGEWEIHNPDYRFVFETGDDVCRVICEVSLKALEENNG